MQIKMDRKGQTGSTITWILATIIIIFILLVTVFISGSIGKSKDINFVPERDTLASKSLFAWLSTMQGEETIYFQLGEDEKLNDFSGELAIEIFDKYRESNLDEVWLGFLEQSNNYFGATPVSVTNVRTEFQEPFVGSNIISESIYVNENKTIRLLIFKER